MLQRFASQTLVVLAAAILVLFACQDAPEVTGPSQLATVTYRLTIVGSGTGSGTVKSVPNGISCSITAGKAAATGCSFAFNQGTTVTLTAKYITGSSFVSWGSTCTGTSTCKFRMTAARTVTAQFLKGPFTI